MDRACEIARNCGYDGYQRALRNIVYKIFDKKTGSGMSVNEQLAEELQKPVTKKLKRKKVCSSFKDNIWAADLAEMGSFSSNNKNVKQLLCVIHVFTKYVWVKPLKDKKGKTVLNPKTAGEGERESIWPPTPVVFWEMYLLKGGWNPGFL